MNEKKGTPDFNQLLEGYAAGTLSEADLQAFYDHLPEHEQAAVEKIMADLRSGRYDGQTDAARRDAMYDRLVLTTRKKVRMFRMTWQAAAAAAILVAAFAGGWMALMKTPAVPAENEVPMTVAKETILPGGEKAILTLSDGAMVQLDSAQNGVLAQQGAVAVSKLKNGMLAYRATGNTKEETHYNKISTPKGGVYAVMLPDGSRAYLNAASSIRFPTVFAETRSVEITGEVYFEVARNPAVQFEVKARGATVMVHGTHFNVHAYEDEAATSVTLLEGAVSVANGRESITLQPGQQAVAAADLRKMEGVVDLDEVMAWKNGLFHFENLALPEIMRQISRWYDVDVTYRGNTANRRFSGVVSRSSSITDVLQFMRLAGVRFEIAGRNITVIQ